MKRIFCLILILIIFSGCVSNPSEKANIEIKENCLRVTSIHPSQILKCKDDCIQKIKSEFSYLFSQNIKPNQRIIMEQILNNANEIVRESNILKEEIISLRHECDLISTKNAYQNTSKIFEKSKNFTIHFLLTLNKIEIMHSRIFTFLINEKNELENEDIDKIKHLKIYKTYAKLTEHLFNLKDEKKLNGLYSKKLGTLEARAKLLGEDFGFDNISLELSNYSKKLVFSWLNILGIAKLKPLSSLLGDKINSVMYSLEGQVSSDSLGKIDLTEASNLLDSSIGKKYSLLTILNEYLKEKENAMNEAKKYSEKLVKENEKNLISSKEKINILLNSSNEKENNERTKTIELTSLEKTLSLEELNIKILKNNSKFVELTSKKYSIGEKISSLEEMKKDLNKILGELNNRINKKEKNLDLKCKSKIIEIEKLLKKENGLELIFLHNKLKQEKEEIGKSKNLIEKEKSCIQANNTISAIKELLSELKETESLNSCLTDLKILFESEFFSEKFFQRYLLINNPININENLTKSCQILREDIISEIKKNSKIVKLNEIFYTINENKIFLKSSNKKANECDLKNIEKLFSPRLEVIELIKTLNEVKKELNGKNLICSNKVKETLKENLEKNVKIIAFTPINANSAKTTGNVTILIENKFGKEFDIPIELRIKFDSKDSKLITKSLEIQRIDFGKETIISLNKITLSPQSVTLQKELNPPIIKRTQVPKMLSNQKGIIEETLEIKSEYILPLLELELNLPNNAFFENDLDNKTHKISKSIKENYLNLKIRNVQKNDQIKFLYSVLHPITLELKENTSYPIDSNKTKIVLKYSIRNNLPIKIKNSSIILPLNLSEQYENLSVYSISNVFKIQKETNLLTIKELSETQKTEFTIEYIVSDLNKYIASEKEKLLEIIKNIENSKNSSFTNEILEIKKNLNKQRLNLVSLQNYANKIRITKEKIIKFQKTIDLIEKEKNEINEIFEKREKLEIFANYPNYKNILLIFKNDKIKKAKLFIKIEESKDIANSLSELYDLEKELTVNNKKIIPILKEILNNSFKSFKELKKANSKIVLSKTKTQELELKIENEYSYLKEILSQEEFYDFSISWVNFSNHIQDYNSQSILLLKENLVEIKKTILLILNKTNVNRLHKKISYLKSILENKKMKSINYILPIDSTELNSIEKRLNSLLSKKITSEIYEFKNELDKNNFVNAINSISSFKEIERIKEYLIETKNYLNKKINTIKLDSNSAIKYAKTQNHNENEIKKAEKEVQKGNYGLAILYANNSLEQNENNTKILYAIPILAILIIGIILWQYLKKNNKSKKNSEIEHFEID